MVSRENNMVIGFVLAALALSYGGSWLTDLPSELLIGILIVVGVVAPIVVNSYLDER